jgi:hypothetical protein
VEIEANMVKRKEISCGQITATARTTISVTGYALDPTMLAEAEVRPREEHRVNGLRCVYFDGA